MELKRCMRCGKFYDSEVDVCHDCVAKDTADISKLKAFMVEGYNNDVTKLEIVNVTGISVKNLDRYLGYEEFNNIYLSDAENSKNKDLGKIKT